MAKASESQNGIFDTFIYENNGNEEKREVKGHRLHVRRKLRSQVVTIMLYMYHADLLIL